MSITINPPAGPWTVADLAQVPDAGFRFEIHEGNLVMMSPVTVWHSEVARRVATALRAAGQPAVMEVGVRRSDRSTRIADVGVFVHMPTDTNHAHWAPADLRLVIEVVSDGSEDEDRFLKPRWYAAAGIPEFWRVERPADEEDEAVIIIHKLASTVDGQAQYVETGMTTLRLLESGQAPL